MPFTNIPTPTPEEYAPFYAGYVAALEGDDVAGLLQRQPQTASLLCAGLSDAEARHRYAEGKWSVKEVLGHLSDAERVFGYRALRLSRGDSTPLAGFDERAYVAAGGFDSRRVPVLLNDFAVARMATLSLLRSFDDAAWERDGLVNGSRMTVRAIAYIIAGHVQHHFRILRERYGLVGSEATIAR
jgi:hypothetical protein